MTEAKDELFEQLSNCETEYGFNAQDVKNILNEFFEKHLCIDMEINISKLIKQKGLYNDINKNFQK